MQHAVCSLHVLSQAEVKFFKSLVLKGLLLS